ncbi:MAG TPA: DUF2784 domain-containing protein [Ideonella sp.]|nr:DUF2784 domain-containing protein [Ideonella sp.]
MLYALAADAVVWLHAAFIAFVVAGGVLLARWPRAAWLHLPAAAWGAWIEFSGAVCPLTPLENRLRALAGERGYAGGFVEHYLLPLIYPAALTREVQFVLGAVVIALNALAYGCWIRHRRAAARAIRSGACRRSRAWPGGPRRRPPG